MYYFVPLGYNWIVPGKPGGTEARCDALLKYCAEDYLPSEICSFVLTADRPLGSNHQPMADEMADYIRQKSENSFYPIPRPMGWGTLAEIENAIKVIREDRNGGRIAVIISTNHGHMPRVRLYWRVLAPKEWKVTFIPANHSFTKTEWFQETAKVVRDLYRIATGKINRTDT
jgi:hypothetical protein